MWAWCSDEWNPISNGIFTKSTAGFHSPSGSDSPVPTVHRWVHRGKPPSWSPVRRCCFSDSQKGTGPSHGPSHWVFPALFVGRFPKSVCYDWFHLVFCLFFWHCLGSLAGIIVIFWGILMDLENPENYCRMSPKNQWLVQVQMFFVLK